MHVGLNMLYLVPGETGGRETYARELVPALIEQAPELQLTAFVNRDAGARLAAELGGNGIRGVVLPISPRNRAQWGLAEITLVSLAAQRARVDVLHSLANFGPLVGRFARVLTIHDLHFRAVPELLSRSRRVGTSALVTAAARRAHRIVAVSAAGRDELIVGLGIERERIDLVRNGVRSPARAPSSTDLRPRYELGRRRVALTVASNLPHKNLPVLIEALATIAPPERPVLIIAGHGGDDGALRAQAVAAGVAEDVRLLGHRPTAELESLYALADCLVLPTLHEGFGLPVLEAMARSVPVACSDIAALREVAGAGALYFDPRAPAQIAASITQLLGDAALASRLREQGRKRVAAFSWSAAAAATLASYRRALERT